MLRIAVPNKGSLAESSIAILKEAGYRQRTDSRDLVLIDNDNSVEFSIFVLVTLQFMWELVS